MGDAGERATQTLPERGEARVRVLPLAAISAVALGLQVFQARLVAYSVHVMLVYAVIGIALLGFGAAGTLVALRREWLEPARLPRALAVSALAFAASIALAHAAFVRLTPHMQEVDALALCVAGLLTLPFLCAGTVVTLALASAGRDVGRAYAANLIGSGAGCFLPLALLGPLPGDRLLGLFSVLAWCGAALYVRAASPGIGLRAASWATFAVCVFSLAFAQRVFPIQPEPPPSGQLAFVYAHAAAHGIRVQRRFDRWNPTGRIEIVSLSNVPGGPEPYHAMFYAQDSTAGSSLVHWDGRTRSAVRPSAADPGTFVSRMCSETLYGQGYHRPRPRVLVIGLGGGPDVQCALYNEARSVDVVEINRDSIAAVRGPFDRWLGGIGSSRRVRFHERDGRSFIRARGARYDLIQLSGVDTKNSLVSGGLALSENHLYTRQAFDDYLARLDRDGVVSIIRFGEPESLRLAATAIASLRALGAAHPEQHIALLRTGIANGVLVRRQPWTAADARELAARMHPAHFRGIRIYYYSDTGIPFEHPAEIEHLPTLDSTGRAGAFFRYAEAGKLAQFEQLYPYDISPTSDDRPFFFDVFRYDRPEVWLAYPHVRALRNLLASMLALSLLLILAPLRKLPKTGPGGGLAAPVLFTCIGLGYVLIEIWLLHRFSMFLGHQAYSLSVVLSTLLCATGLGAALGGRVLPDGRRRALWGAAAVLAIVLLVAAVLPPMLDAAWNSGLPLRAACAVAFVAPLGFVLGQPFVGALSWLRERQPGRAPWCIGINGFASVIASVAVIPLAMSAGYSGVLVAGAACYLLAALAAARLQPADAAG